MPYSLRDTCVVKTDTGKVVKCHKTRQEALDHLAALKINVEDASVALTGSIKFEADAKDPRIIRFTDAVLARRETNANLDDIDADGVAELAASLVGMPIDVEHDGEKNTGYITAARQVGEEVHIDGVIWTHRAMGYEVNPDDILNGTYQLSVEADAKSAMCSICSKTFSSDSEYCDHLKPDKKRFYGAKRFLKGLRGLGAAITKRPAGTGTSFDLNGVYLVAHLMTDDDNFISLLASDADTIYVEAISKRKDVSDADKKRAVKEYGDVKYADEKNKKYPIDTAEHVRAAWNYISHAENAAKYSSSEVASIKRKIVSAWKAKIDKSGPPSAADNKSQGGLNMTLEELNAALDAKLNPIAARLEAVEATVKANVASDEDTEDMQKKHKEEMEAAMKDMEANMAKKYEAERADMEAQITKLNEAVASKDEAVLASRTEMLRLKLVGSVMDVEKFDAEKEQWLATPDSVIETIVEAASRSSKDNTRGSIWLNASAVQRETDEYTFKVN